MVAYRRSKTILEKTQTVSLKDGRGHSRDVFLKLIDLETNRYFGQVLAQGKFHCIKGCHMAAIGRLYWSFR